MGPLSAADMQYELVLFALVSDSVTQAGFELMVLLPQLSECWDSKYVPPYLLTHSVDWLHWARRAQRQLRRKEPCGQLGFSLAHFSSP